MDYILRRAGFYLLGFITAITLNFFLPRLMPGDPVQMYLAELYKGGGYIDESTIRAVEEMFGYNTDQSLIVSYFKYLGNIFTGNWGLSFANYPQTVLESLSRGLTWTLFLMGTALVISFFLNTILGILVAWRRGSISDTIITVSGQILANIPAVIIAIILLYAFSEIGKLPIFPIGYAITPLFEPANIFEYIADVLYHATLPIMAILITSFGGIMGMRANMINQLNEDYIIMGMAKGVPDRKIMMGYAARNAMLPVITSLAMQIGFLLGGSLIVENVFNYPGLGTVMLRAVNKRDYPLMQGILLISTVIMLTANFMADISSFIIDPRLRKQGIKN